VVEVAPPVVAPQHEISASETRATASTEKVDKVVPGKISERLEKTQLWLNHAADNNFSIQLFMARTSDAEKVEAFLRDVPETLDFTEIYIYETVINGRAWYSVLYNDFATQDEAIAKLDALPASLKASDPYLRRISALKKDVAR
jgi:DamX protein